MFKNIDMDGSGIIIFDELRIGLYCFGFKFIEFEIK